MSRFQSEEGPGYTWEQEYEKTWEGLGIGEDGSYQDALLREHLLQKRRRLHMRPEKIRRGMMRHLFVVIDMSSSMEEADLKPTRLDCTVSTVDQFIAEYFDQNPISQVGLIATKNGKADRITELSGNIRKHQEALKSHVNIKALSGEPSLQNSIELCRQILRGLPPHASREIVIIMGSLSTCDPGSIFKTIEDCKKDSVMVSIIGLAAAVKVCETICRGTNGSYNVVLDELHFKDLLMANLTPPPVAPQMETALMNVGFPKRESPQALAPCACHDGKISGEGYLCPRCGFKFCEVPTECTVCGLMLVAAPHIARSYCHLFPPPGFKPIGAEQGEESQSEKMNGNVASHCYGCTLRLDVKVGVSHCPRCRQDFCIDCDLYIHEILHSCPGCCLLPMTVVQDAYAREEELNDKSNAMET